MRRVSIAWLMVGTAAIAFPCALVAATLRDQPLLGLRYGLDMGLWPTLPILGLYLFAVIRRRRSFRPFDVGFLAMGLAAVCAYVVISLGVPELVLMPIAYYINEIEIRFMDCDGYEAYIRCLLIHGFLLAVPQLLIAVTGGFVVRQM